MNDAQGPRRVLRATPAWRTWVGQLWVCLALALTMVSTSLTSAPAAAQAGNDAAFVIADAVRMRAEPGDDAPVVATLWMGQPLMVLPSQDAGPRYDGWTHVAPRANPELDGYVAASFVSRTPPNAERLKEDLDRTLRSNDLEGALTVAERLYALNPTARTVLVDMIEIHEARGDTERAMSMRAFQRGLAPKLLAYCSTEGALGYEGPYALGAYTPGEGRSFTALPSGVDAAWRLSEDPSMRSVRRAELQRTHWFTNDDGALARADHSGWALTPWVRFDARETRGEAPHPGYRTPAGISNARAGCAAPGQVRSNEAFADAPLRPTRVEPLLPILRQTPGIGPHLDKARAITAGRVPWAEDLVSVSLTFDRRSLCPGCVTRAPEDVIFHALVDVQAGTARAVRGTGRQLDTPKATLVRVRNIYWGRWLSSGETFGLVEWIDTARENGGGSYVDWFVLGPDGYRGGHTFTIETWVTEPEDAG